MDQTQIDDFGLTLEEGKRVLRQVQARLTQLYQLVHKQLRRPSASSEVRCRGSRPGERQSRLQQAALLQAHQEYGCESESGEQAVALVASVEDAKVKLDRALVAIGEARAAIEMAEINLGYTEVFSPFDNAVSNHLVDVEELVGAGAATPHAVPEKVEQLFSYMLHAFP